MAEALLRARVDSFVPPVEIVSAGLLDAGHAASDATIQALAERDLDVTRHRSRRIDADLVSSAALVLGMERRHVQEAVLLAREAWPRSFALKELVRRGEERGPRGDEPLAVWLARIHEGRTPEDLLGVDAADDVADPYGQSARVHRRTLAELDDLVARLARLIWVEP